MLGGKLGEILLVLACSVATAKTSGLRRHIAGGLRARRAQSKPANCRVMQSNAFIFHADSPCKSTAAACFEEERGQAHSPWRGGTESLWGTESERETYLYLRLNKSNIDEDQYGEVYQFQATRDVPLLHTAESVTARNGTVESATADGLRALFDELRDGDVVDVNLWWGNLTSFFEGPAIAKGSTIQCTKKNLLRLAFGIQGGLSQALHRSGCGKEPSLSQEQLLDFSVKRFSRTDIDDAFVKMLCNHGFSGYISPKLPHPPADSPVWTDHKKRFKGDYVYSQFMDSEAFICDAASVMNYASIDMIWDGKAHEWGRKDGSAAKSSKYSDVSPCPPRMLL